tara:strand:- start:215 stop:511 length:297 start_codon:yes stop_codon:yes gene_type:complete
MKLLSGARGSTEGVDTDIAPRLGETLTDWPGFFMPLMLIFLNFMTPPPLEAVGLGTFIGAVASAFAEVIAFGADPDIAFPTPAILPIFSSSSVNEENS